MLEIVKGLPDNVIAITVKGILTGEEYEEKLIPAIEDKVKKYGKVRLLYQLGEEFEGFTDNAMLEDARLGIKNFNDFEKVAVVSDVGWIINAIKAFGLTVPFQVNTYGNNEFNEAKAWISE
ncbi:STAS/SEC14 domain-containing protein [Methanosarcina hadiensis]|uniref:STAS/SEC14 domain-containing protein n=1 Tax=Methanosarcina hadiensis TaxID=3078083 RepID=UPI0039778D57